MIRALLAAALLAAGPAVAQGDGAAVESEALDGGWVFDVAPLVSFGVTQHISGEIELIPDGEDSWTCRMSVSDYIEEDDVTIRTQQVCIATRDGDSMLIESRVVSVDPTTYSYVPDSFSLTIHSASRMTGDLIAAGGERPEAVFMRPGALVS